MKIMIFQIRNILNDNSKNFRVELLEEFNVFEEVGQLLEIRWPSLRFWLAEDVTQRLDILSFAHPNRRTPLHAAMQNKNYQKLLSIRILLIPLFQQKQKNEKRCGRVSE